MNKLLLTLITLTSSSGVVSSVTGFAQKSKIQESKPKTQNFKSSDFSLEPTNPQAKTTTPDLLINNEINSNEISDEDLSQVSWKEQSKSDKPKTQASKPKTQNFESSDHSLEQTDSPVESTTPDLLIDNEIKTDKISDEDLSQISQSDQLNSDEQKIPLAQPPLEPWKIADIDAGSFDERPSQKQILKAIDDELYDRDIEEITENDILVHSTESSAMMTIPQTNQKVKINFKIRIDLPSSQTEDIDIGSFYTTPLFDDIYLRVRPILIARNINSRNTVYYDPINEVIWVKILKTDTYKETIVNVIHDVESWHWKSVLFSSYGQ